MIGLQGESHTAMKKEEFRALCSRSTRRQLLQHRNIAFIFDQRIEPDFAKILSHVARTLVNSFHEHWLKRQVERNAAIHLT